MNENQRKKLPIGIQSFINIRTDGGYYYADKTNLALQLANEGTYYFLSRPRRFGKSLFVDTLRCLFEGRQELFQGLAAENKWDWSKKHPVIRFDFSAGPLASPAALQVRIQESMRLNRLNLDIVKPESFSEVNYGEDFNALIMQAHAKYGQKAVVLIDEYDKPILDHLAEPETAKTMREMLKALYSTIKGADEHLQFVFITGVSKFSKVSLFSGLNNLTDITLEPEFSAICGYTDNDIDTVFAPELKGLDRQRIKDYYNGYNWLGEGVYNPFDVLQLFRKRTFDNHWEETGSTSFLMEQIAKRDIFSPDVDKIFASEDLISSFDVDDIPIEALMFQTGYLTIKSKIELPALTEYELCYPNLEVKASVNRLMARYLMGDKRAVGNNASALYRALLANDFNQLRQVFQRFFSSIPFHWYTTSKLTQYEGYYASIVYSHFAGLGLDVQAEDTTNMGRLDMVVRFNHCIYLFEFKVLELTPKGSALAQIKQMKYADKFKDGHTPIYLIGVEFSKTDRNIVGFEVELVGA